MQRGTPWSHLWSEGCHPAGGEGGERRGEGRNEEDGWKENVDKEGGRKETKKTNKQEKRQKGRREKSTCMAKVTW